MIEHQSDDSSVSSDEIIELTKIEKPKKKLQKEFVITDSKKMQKEFEVIPAPQGVAKVARERKSVADCDLLRGDLPPEAVLKKPMSAAHAAGLAKARETRKNNLLKQKQTNEEAKHVIEHVYKQELEQKLTKSMLPKYERSIKKEILEKLKKKKLEELKRQYNYKSESSSDSSSSEEEVIVKKHKLKQSISAPEPKKKERPLSILERYRSMGF